MSYFLFESCRPIKGYCRSVIYDLQRNSYDFIPNELLFLLKSNEIFGERNNLETKNYIEFLVDKEYVFKIENPRLAKGFSSLNLEWYSPSIIENTILNIDNCENRLKFKETIYFLNCLNCFHIQLNIINKISIEDLVKLLNFFEDTIVETIELIVQYNNYTVEALKSFCEEFLRIKSIIICSSPYNQIENYGEDSLSNIVFTKFSKEVLLCSGVNDYNFATNYLLFAESQAHHTYFNRKMYIGAKGDLKNAPECEEIFGNINDIKNVDELKQIITTSEFQKYWFVHKELCDVCKECEFRHMCVDNRLPYQRKDSSWYHKTECNYNPYICKWKEEEGYQALEECGVISNENGFSINHEKIASINKILWEEEETENA